MTPIAQIVENYAIQFFLSASNHPGYFLPQPPGNPIVPSTKKVWSGGRAFAIQNAGSSDAPVAISLFGKQSSGALILRPGEAIYPGDFDAFEYGLPFGWAGGGTVMLKVALSKDVRFEIPSARPEIIYWRAILEVEADAAVLPALRRNWPSKFPWEYAFGESGRNQQGTPSIHVEPSRTLLFLTSDLITGAIAAATDYKARLFFRDVAETTESNSNNDFFTDVVWSTPPDGQIWPGMVVTLPAQFDRLDLNLGGVTVFSPDASITTGDFITVVRYGRI